MIIITGGCGFIGSNLVNYLNTKGYDDILVVDDLTDGKKFKYLSVAKITDYLDYQEFRKLIVAGFSFNSTIEAVFHLGACSDTTEWDGHFMMDNNFQYSKELFNYCQKFKIPFIYASSASVYGDNSQGFSENEKCENPLNVYAWSKLLFDRWVNKQKLTAQVVGLRYFNVYGPNENHKGHMASVAYHLMQQHSKGESMRLFGAYDGYKNGMQERDFIYVTDVCNVNFWFLENPNVSGVFNCGTGKAEPFLTIAKNIKMHYPDSKLEFISFPEHLKGSYQSYTQANISKLLSVGYTSPFLSVKQGISEYIKVLQKR